MSTNQQPEWKQFMVIVKLNSTADSFKHTEYVPRGDNVWNYYFGTCQCLISTEGPKNNQPKVYKNVDGRLMIQSAKWIGKKEDEKNTEAMKDPANWDNSVLEWRPAMMSLKRMDTIELESEDKMSDKGILVRYRNQGKKIREEWPIRNGSEFSVDPYKRGLDGKENGRKHAVRFNVKSK